MRTARNGRVLVSPAAAGCGGVILTDDAAMEMFRASLRDPGRPCWELRIRCVSPGHNTRIRASLKLLPLYRAYPLRSRSRSSYTERRADSALGHHHSRRHTPVDWLYTPWVGGALGVSHYCCQASIRACVALRATPRSHPQNTAVSIHKSNILEKQSRHIRQGAHQTSRKTLSPDLHCTANL